MNSNHQDGQQRHHAERDEYTTAREAAEARLTAYALGQLDAREQA